MARGIYHGPGVVLLRDSTHHSRVEDPPLPEHPSRGENLGGGAHEPKGTPFLGGRHKERFVVRQIDAHGRIAAQGSRHLPGLGDGGPEDAAPVGPLQGKILKHEKPELVTGLVECAVRHVGVDPDGVHTGLAHQGGVRAQKLLRCPGRVSVRGQVVDPTQEDTLPVEVDLPVSELHGTGAETRLLFCPVTRQHQLVQRLLAPVPRRPDPYVRQSEANLEAVFPLLESDLPLELDVPEPRSPVDVPVLPAWRALLYLE